MFNEVDDDINGSITFEEWVDFWRNVVAQEEYDEADVIQELKSIKVRPRGWPGTGRGSTGSLEII